ncbi:MAG: Stp1/IreP family PP2C-type Ser/Thr phosphatase [Chlamydiales bacterium]|nr:Stp1/IreP family PP2C-type Ser/Thr phosphatase [Chlamydiia bacterium]MCP5508437.1 Stp1/IreP family PP2C-type Ser/Thr phosphatase [Chlamydiales bacterium]
MPYQVEAFGLTDTGLVRQNNEDVWAELPELRFYVLADGMGGHRAGEIAAQKAVDTLCDMVKQMVASEKNTLTLEESREMIAHAIEVTNGVVYDMGSKNPELHGMGTTLCCVHFHRDGLIYAHVGDSRIYRLREEKLDQMTKDHSLLREMVELGQIEDLYAEDFQYKNIITKAIGTEPFVEPTVQTSDLAHGDVYLICSDGLSDLLCREEIKITIDNAKTIKDAGKQLVELAIKKGGHDNVTVVMLEVLECADGENISR